MTRPKPPQPVMLSRHEANVLLHVLARGNDHPDTTPYERQCVTWVVERIMREFAMFTPKQEA